MPDVIYECPLRRSPVYNSFVWSARISKSLKLILRERDELTFWDKEIKSFYCHNKNLKGSEGWLEMFFFRRKTNKERVLYTDNYSFEKIKKNHNTCLKFPKIGDLVVTSIENN